MVKEKDSTDGLGKAIGEEFDGDEGDDKDEDADDSADDSGGKDEKSEGETQTKGDEDEDEDSEEDGSETPAALLTEDGELTPEAQAIVDSAVSKAVGAVNSTKDKAAAEAAAKAREREETLLQEQETRSLNGLTGDDATARRNEIDIARDRRAIVAEKQEAADMSRIANAERLAVSGAKFGVTFDELAAANSPEEQEAIVLGRERTYWQRVAEGKQTAGEDADEDTAKAGDKKKRGKAKKDAPAGSKKKTDTGGRGSAPGSSKASEGNTLGSFAQGLVKDGVVPGGGITKVES